MSLRTSSRTNHRNNLTSPSQTESLLASAKLGRTRHHTHADITIKKSTKVDQIDLHKIDPWQEN